MPFRLFYSLLCQRKAVVTPGIQKAGVRKYQRISFFGLQLQKRLKEAEAAMIQFREMQRLRELRKAEGMPRVIPGEELRGWVAPQVREAQQIRAQQVSAWEPSLLGANQVSAYGLVAFRLEILNYAQAFVHFASCTVLALANPYLNSFAWGWNSIQLENIVKGELITAMKTLSPANC